MTQEQFTYLTAMAAVALAQALSKEARTRYEAASVGFIPHFEQPA